MKWVVADKTRSLLCCWTDLEFLMPIYITSVDLFDFWLQGVTNAQIVWRLNLSKITPKNLQPASLFNCGLTNNSWYVMCGHVADLSSHQIWHARLHTFFRYCHQTDSLRRISHGHHLGVLHYTKILSSQKLNISSVPITIHHTGLKVKCSW
jgi:hypothetical protein